MLQADPTVTNIGEHPGACAGTLAVELIGLKAELRLKNGIQPIAQGFRTTEPDTRARH